MKDLPKFNNRADLVKFLKNKAVDIRKDIVALTVSSGGGHLGGAFSMTDLLVVLYHHVLRVRPDDPKWPDRDRFILSKGHGSIGLCPVLADRGFIDRGEMLATFNKFNSPYGMHTDRKKIAGVELSCGSLGHGLPVGGGMAMAGKMNKAPWRVFVLTSDGECNEGSTWEAAQSAAHFKSGNLVAVVDRNRFVIDGPTEEIMGLEPLADKWMAFGWNTIVVDGHDIEKLLDVFDNLPPVDSEVPTAVIAETKKGRGVSFMEGEGGWHYGGLDSDREAQALAELEAARIP